MPFEIAPQEIEQQHATTPMRLSVGIRIGCKLAPTQCFGQPFLHGAACALGAYALANGAKGEEDEDDKAYARILAPFDKLPADDAEDPSILFTIATRWNDDARLSREQIADRLEARGL